MNQKRNLLIIFLSHVVFIGILWAFIPMSPVNSPTAIIIASLSTAACIMWSTLKLSPLQSQTEFQSNFLVCLALADLVMLIGTFLGSTWPQAVFASVAWCLMLLFVLPKLILR